MSLDQEKLRLGNIQGLQVLRAAAALMVVMHHARLSVPGSSAWPAFGETGVDIFFVISGFVMAHTTRNLRVQAKAGERLRDCGDFLRKRLVRVVPLYWLALVWTARRDLTQGVVGIDLLKDFAFLPHPNATYPDWLAPTLLQGWTLNYEMFFYALFAVSLLFDGRRIFLLISALLAMVAIGYGAGLAGWPIDAVDWLGVARRFYTNNIVLEFGYGVLLQRLVAGRQASTLPRVIFALIVLGGLLLLSLGHGYGPRGLVQGLPALLIVWASLHAFVGLRLPLLEQIGDASYAIYLFHWASFGAVKPMTNWLGMSVGQPSGVTLLMGAHISVAVVSGLAIHKWIERPFMHWAQSRLSRRLVLRPVGPPA